MFLCHKYILLTFIIQQSILTSNKLSHNHIQMQPRLQFYPDIETKFEQLIVHMNDKNKITEELIKILEEICNFQSFYSKSLDNFANSISKLLVGKDPLKDILIILERIIGSKSEQSGKLAQEIKDDLIPHIRASVNLKAQQSLKDKQMNARNIRASMQKKLRLLFSSQNNFKKAVSEINNLPKTISNQQKKQTLEIYQKKQQQFSDMIDSYNSSLDDYMLKYTEICEELSQLEANRKMQYRDSISKLVIFEINYIKNLEYNFSRYMDILNKMEGKIMIQERILGGGEPFYTNRQQTSIIHLAKISNKNYIDSIVGKKKVTQSLLSQQIKISQLKTTYQTGEVSKQVYHNLVKTIFPIMNFVHKSNHTNLLIQIVFFAKNITIIKGNIRLTLLTSLLCHGLFSDEKFWLDYEKRLLDKISREQSLSSGDQQALHKNFSNVLDRDLAMLRLVQINSYITRILQTIGQKYKALFQSKKSKSIDPQQNLTGSAVQGNSLSLQRPNSVSIKSKIFQ